MHYTFIGLHRLHKYEKLFTNKNNWYQELHDHLNKGRKAFDKMQYSFMIKTLNKLGIGRTSSIWQRVSVKNPEVGVRLHKLAKKHRKRCWTSLPLREM